MGDDITALWIAGWDETTTARWYRSALEAAGYRTESMDTSRDQEAHTIITIESRGPRPDCRVQTIISQGDPAANPAEPAYSYVAVRYGTGCPAP